MGPKGREGLEDQGLFSGAVGAALSHEINNVLAIIGELNGLIQDLVNFLPEGETIPPEKLDKVTTRIVSEINRGKIFVKQLNTFSHSIESKNIQMDGAEVLETAVGLIARFARLKKVAVVLGDAQTGISIKGDLFDLQHVLYRALELAVCASSEESEIVATLAKNKGRSRFSFENENPHKQAADIAQQTDTLKMLLENLDGSVDIDIQGDTPWRIVIHLPFVLQTHNNSKNSS